LEHPQELQGQFLDVENEIKLMDDLWDVTGRSNIFYKAISSEKYVIDENTLEVIRLAGGQPLMLVDITVPRSIDEKCKVERPQRCVYSLFSS
jgi:glutamyl-tRNA reductase